MQLASTQLPVKPSLFKTLSDIWLCRK